MKTLILSTSDIEGGAARAAYRLHQGLQTVGVSSQMLVRARFSGHKSVIAEKSILTKLGPQMNNLPMRRYPNRERKLFSSQWFPDAIARKVADIDPDIVNMHWVCNGFLKIETLAKLNKPLFWTLQDMWAFTGGCHYNEACDRYKDSCGRCPQLNSNKDRDLSRSIWQRKYNAWKNLNLTIVTPSSWMADCVRASSLFRDRRVEVIPFCLDTERYRPVDPKVARSLLKLPQDKQIILFGALSATSDKRKGFHLLMPALQKLSQSGWGENIELAVFGASEPENPIDLGFKTHYLGSFQDDLALALVYSAADVMIVPSLQESFGQTASEALACATPVVAFNATGLKDIVDHQQTGYLVQPYEIEDLARGIAWVLEDKDRHKALTVQAREKAERVFALELQAQRYIALFEEILETARK
ncbi:MAG: glycosyltransferase family 4 protein [Leptolyngbyaceae cyanobacterium MO_188.B28]|nr:glycosyltransferase family 4 protein [Leptolyngbyaceae cyanobacterium MO_188.B28]